MLQFRLPLALFAALSLGGCYYSWYGDLRVQHNASILSNSVDDYQLPPQPVDRVATFTMHVRDLPSWGWYPSALHVIVDNQTTAWKMQMSPKEGNGLSLRLSLRTVEGRELWAKTYELSAMHADGSYGRNGKGIVLYPLFHDIPEDLPELRSYDVVLEVLKPSVHAGDQVVVGSL